LRQIVVWKITKWTLIQTFIIEKSSTNARVALSRTVRTTGTRIMTSYALMIYCILVKGGRALTQS